MKSLIARIRGMEVWAIALLVAVVLLIGFAASGYLSRWLGSVGQVATGARVEPFHIECALGAREVQPGVAAVVRE